MGRSIMEEIEELDDVFEPRDDRDEYSDETEQEPDSWPWEQPEGYHEGR